MRYVIFILKYVILLSYLTSCVPVLYNPDSANRRVIIPTPPATLSSMNGFDNTEIVKIGSNSGYLRWPVKPPNGKWVLYAPSFVEGSTPSVTQMEFYFDALSNQGITVVGVDVGESYGSPTGRAAYEEFYEYLVMRHFKGQGCMIVQSRGALMGYNWIMDHPGRVKCVAGIYPLLSVTDYIGVDAMALAWGVLGTWLTANLTTQSPLERHNSLPGVFIHHLHGDADMTVRLSNDQQFISTLQHGTITVIPGQGHEFFTPEFFQSQDLLNFIIQND